VLYVVPRGRLRRAPPQRKRLYRQGKQRIAGMPEHPRRRSACPLSLSSLLCQRALGSSGTIAWISSAGGQRGRRSKGTGVIFARPKGTSHFKGVVCFSWGDRDDGGWIEALELHDVFASLFAAVWLSASHAATNRVELLLLSARLTRVVQSLGVRRTPCVIAKASINELRRGGGGRPAIPTRRISLCPAPIA
jgi:hypothetical protein